MTTIKSASADGDLAVIYLNIERGWGVGIYMQK